MNQQCNRSVDLAETCTSTAEQPDHFCTDEELRIVYLLREKPPTFPVKFPCMLCGGVHEVSFKGFVAMIAIAT